MPNLRHLTTTMEMEHRILQSSPFDPSPMPRHSNLTGLFDPQAAAPHSSLPDTDYTSWDTKATILLAQGIFITFLVVIMLIACGRKHYRKMNQIRERELANRAEAELTETTHGENTTEQSAQERTPLQQAVHILTTPFRALNSMINAWSSAPSTDYEYYRRILERMEAERESRREGPEERTERLMSAFLKGQCVWEIEEEHFINPLEKKQVYAGSSTSLEKDIDVDIEAGLEDQYVVQDATTDGKDTDIDAPESGGVDDSVVENDHAGLTDATKTQEEAGPSSDLQNSQNNVTSDSDDQLPSKADASTAKIETSNSFDDTPGYIYLNVSHCNRRRANTLPEVASNTQKSTSISESHSTPSLPQSSSDITSDKSGTINQRTIPNQCAICLCDYTKGDTIILSSTSCPHAFHQECIVEWLVKMQEGTPCPCCRQTFVELDERVIESRRVGRRREMSEEELGRLRRHIQLGLQRGRAFDTAVIRL